MMDAGQGITCINIQNFDQLIKEEYAALDLIKKEYATPDLIQTADKGMCETRISITISNLPNV